MPNKDAKKVSKALAPEELTLLSNVQSILDELIQMSGGAADNTLAPEEEIMSAETDSTEEDMMDKETEGKEVKMILKGMEETPSDASTASDDAEDRMDEVQTKETEDNVTEVAKALIALLAPKSEVKKSVPTKSKLEQVLEQIVQVQKAQQANQVELSEAFGHLLEGMGIADQIKVAKASKEQPAKEIHKGGNEEVLQVLKSLMSSKENVEENPTSNQEKVRKNLTGEVLRALVTK